MRAPPQQPPFPPCTPPPNPKLAPSTGLCPWSLGKPLTLVATNLAWLRPVTLVTACQPGVRGSDIRVFATSSSSSPSAPWRSRGMCLVKGGKKQTGVAPTDLRWRLAGGGRRPCAPPGPVRGRWRRQHGAGHQLCHWVLPRGNGCHQSAAHSATAEPEWDGSGAEWPRPCYAERLPWHEPFPGLPCLVCNLCDSAPGRQDPWGRAVSGPGAESTREDAAPQCVVCGWHSCSPQSTHNDSGVLLFVIESVYVCVCVPTAAAILAVCGSEEVRKTREANEVVCRQGGRIQPTCTSTHR